MAAHLEELTLVEYQAHQFARVVRSLAVLRNDPQQLLHPPVRVVAGLDAGRDLAGGVGQVGEELLDLVEGVLFRLRLVVDLAALMHMHRRAAELLLVEGLADRAADDRRP